MVHHWKNSLISNRKSIPRRIVLCVTMPYTAQIESTKQKLAETKQAIKELQEKKATITDAAELKAI